MIAARIGATIITDILLEGRHIDLHIQETVRMFTNLYEVDYIIIIVIATPIHFSSIFR